MSYKLTRLPGGARLVTADLPHLQTVSVGLWAGVGSRYECARTSGASHFIEHLLFKGTPTRTAFQIVHEIESIGGYLNAFTSEESTCYYARARAKHLPRVLEVLGDMYLNPTFDPAELERERQVILEEIAMIEDQPAQLVQEVVNHLQWFEHPLGMPISGTEESVGRLSRSDLITFRKRCYTASNTVIAVAGPVDHGEIEELCSGLSLAMPRGRAPRFQRYRRSQARPRFLCQVKDVEQSNLVLSFRGVSRQDPGRFAIKLLNVILGETMSSRLVQTIREKHGLAYTVGSSVSYFAETGAFQIYAGLPADKVEKALRLISRELQRILHKGPTAGELEMAKEYTLGMMKMSLENAGEQMNWCGEQTLFHGHVETPESIEEKLHAVTREEVEALARKVLRLERSALALIQPEPLEDPFEQGILAL